MELQSSPLRVGLPAQKMPPPATLVIFGATGDLTQRKLLPALFDLYCDKRLPEGFTVIGFARREKSSDDFRAEMRDAVAKFARNNPINNPKWDAFARGVYYHQAEFHDLNGCIGLAHLCDQIDQERGTQGNRLF